MQYSAPYLVNNYQHQEKFQYPDYSLGDRAIDTKDFHLESALNAALNESNSLNERINQLSHQYNAHVGQTPQTNKQMLQIQEGHMHQGSMGSNFEIPNDENENSTYSTRKQRSDLVNKLLKERQVIKFKQSLQISDKSRTDIMS